MIIAKSTDKAYLTEMTLEGTKVHPVYADQPVKSGGGGQDMRPGQLLLSSYAACINITLCQLLKEEKLPYEAVNVTVDMDNSEEGVTKLYRKIDIVSDIPQEKKDELMERVKRCPVCKILNNRKEFYDL